MISILLLFLLASSGAYAQESTFVPPTPQESDVEIDARRFDVKPIQKSNSGKVYLFESKKVTPKTGNLILLYDQDQPVMAFRVLKNEADENRFVAKRVRRYGNIVNLILNREYVSIEKTGVRIPPPPVTAPVETEAANITESTDPKADPETTSETTDPTLVPPAEDSTQKTEGEAATEEAPAQAPETNDPELDRNETEKLNQIEKEQAPTEADESENIDVIEYDEYKRIDPLNNMFTIFGGFLGNSSNFDTSVYLSNGVGVSYTRVLFRDVFFDGRTPQDAFAFEGGLEQYSISQKDSANDRYSLLPFYGNLVYQLHLNQTFALTAYGGLQFNYMLSTSSPGESLDSLQGFQPNFGFGFLYCMGPQWYFKFDIGWDKIVGGLSLKW